MLAGRLGDRSDASEAATASGPSKASRGSRPTRRGIWAALTLSRAGQRGEDAPVGVLVQVGGDRAFEVLLDRAEGAQDGHQGDHGIAAGPRLDVVDDSGRGLAKTLDQLGGRSPAAVAVLGAEGGHALLAQVSGRDRGRIASQELQRDGRYRHP